VVERQGNVSADLVLDVALKGKLNRLSRFRLGCPYGGFPLQGAAFQARFGAARMIDAAIKQFAIFIG
jgi:hypothetical protein